jgi:hypothetical protein
MCKIPVLVALAKQVVNSVVGGLLGKTMMSEEVDNIVGATIILWNISEAPNDPVADHIPSPDGTIRNRWH